MQCAASIADRWPKTRCGYPLHQTDAEFARVDSRLKDWLARETWVSGRY